MPAGLPTQVIALPIAGGLNQAIDARALEPPGAWLTVDNWVYDQAGALKKRHGYGYLARTLTSSGDLLEPTRLDTLGSQLLVYGHESLTGLPHLYSWISGLSKWAKKDDVCPASIVRETFQRGPVGSGGAHVSVVNGLLVVTYFALGYGIMYKVLDATTGAVVVDETRAYVGSLPRGASFECGGYVVMVYTPGLADRQDTFAETVRHGELRIKRRRRRRRCARSAAAGSGSRRCARPRTSGSRPA